MIPPFAQSKLIIVEPPSKGFAMTQNYIKTYLSNQVVSEPMGDPKFWVDGVEISKAEAESVSGYSKRKQD